MANVKKFLHLDSDGQLREQTATDTIQVANGVNALDAINKGQLDSAVGDLTDLINAEAARATQAEAALGDSLTAETAARVAADAALSASLTSETNARTAAETALGGRIDTEISDRQAAVAAEQAARIAADSALRTDLDAEIVNRENADDALDARIDALETSSSTALTNAINSLTADLEAEEAARIAADSALQAEIDAEEVRAAAAEAAEQAARIAAVNALQSDIDAEEARALAAKTAIAADLDTEEAARAAGDLTNANAIAAEQSRAQTAEGNLEAAIDAEEARALAAEAVLTADLAAEIARATAAEAAKLQEAKDYADARVQGLSWKASVDYAYPRTGAFTLPAQAAALISAEGLAVGNRVLVYSADQSAHADNGIYVVTASGFARAADMAAGADAAGSMVYVERATDAGAAPGTSFVCSNAGTAIVGTDALSFVIASRMENLSFGSGVQKIGTAVSAKVEAAKPVFVNGSGEMSFRITGPDLSIDGSGNLKVDGDLVGGEFVNADGKHAHEAVSVVIASAASVGTAVKSDGTASTYDAAMFRGVVDAKNGGDAKVVTAGLCSAASGALSSFSADEIVYLGSAAGVFSKYADIPSGKWAVPVGFCVDSNTINVHRMPAALKA